MIFAPPRHGKSELVSRRLPAFWFGKYPDAQIIACSYGADLASRMNRDVQKIIDSPLYADLFPDTKLNSDNVRSNTQGSYLRNSECFEIVGHTGIYKAAGVGGPITGHGATLGIIDDPIKNQQDADSPTVQEAVWSWYTSTFFTRLEKNAQILLTLTRWNKRDLAGRILTENPSDWEVISIPAIDEYNRPIWPNKYSYEALQTIKRNVGSKVWQSLYMQNPTDSEGSRIKRHQIKYYDKLPEGKLEWIQSWDFTFKNTNTSDYVVGQVWARQGANCYLVDQTRERLDFVETIAAFRSLCAKYPQTTTKLVEEKANGSGIISVLKNEINGIIPVNPQDSKPARLAAVSPLYEAGNVHYPNTQNKPWVSDTIEELLSFPNAAHDDTVDATTQALERFKISKIEILPVNSITSNLSNRITKNGKAW